LKIETPGIRRKACAARDTSVQWYKFHFSWIQHSFDVIGALFQLLANSVSSIAAGCLWWPIGMVGYAERQRPRFHGEQNFDDTTYCTDGHSLNSGTLPQPGLYRIAFRIR